MSDGYCYLHENGDLIFKSFEPESDSPFVKKAWPVDQSDRGNAWQILLEALYYGADVERARELATKWGCDERDFLRMAVRKPATDETREGAVIFFKEILGLDYDAWFNELLGDIADDDYSINYNRIVKEALNDKEGWEERNGATETG